MSTSALGPVDRNSIPIQDRDRGPLDAGDGNTAGDEKERSAPWIVRKLVGSMTGRIVMSSYESLRAAGTSVICLSPWGDSSPLLLPCIRFRDLAVHTIIAATGGMAVVAAPVMGPVSAEIIGTLGDSILVEVGLHEGFALTTTVANDLVIDKSVKRMIPIHSSRLETTAVKVLVITLKYKHTVEDAALGFYRSSVHEDSSLFASVKDYLAIEKGWFSPYLFASSRRPVIPRSMKPDIIFCHGPFLEGDYRVGESLLAESASVILLSTTPEIVPPTPNDKSSHFHLPKLDLPALSTKFFARSRTPSPEPQLAALPPPPAPRRLVILVVGLKPHRTLWTTSARPGESVLQYLLLNGCPAIVVPVKLGAPLIAWDTFTLKELWNITLPADNDTTGSGGEKFEGIVNVLNEYLQLCVDWDRMVLQVDESSQKEGEAPQQTSEEEFRTILRDSLKLLVAAAVRSGESKAVRKEIDEDRSGIAMWRIP